jgi:hypothetical protein
MNTKHSGGRKRTGADDSDDSVKRIGGWWVARIRLPNGQRRRVRATTHFDHREIRAENPVCFRTVTTADLKL